MKRIDIQVFANVTIAMVFIFVFAACLPARAQNASDALYKSKCAACHGADGSGSAVGQKLGAHDFHSATVQKQTDAELTAIIDGGKNKMPSYGKTLKADEIAGLVAYIRAQSAAK